ncbi:uncharacterized protein LOC105695936 [Orussus abietinus]|uniref:uncharacterized protein LOC105695936 n=1 Tax=Orussus abietinus TaxID=222816 RepID=UPI00062562FF|nr:uncharacterized protein LOC105695936 [Orussus abietinus]
MFSNMAGNKVICSLQNVGNGEKMSDNSDSNLTSSVEDIFCDSADYVPCPDFQFLTSTCYICNGYYGPCFGEPVCATCHAFLFPDDVGLLQVPLFSEKTDDEDSGNDEPTDLYYNAERRTSQHQQSSPQNRNPVGPNIRNVPNQNIDLNEDHIQAPVRNYSVPAQNDAMVGQLCLRNNPSGLLRNIHVSANLNPNIQNGQNGNGYPQNRVPQRQNQVHDPVEEDLPNLDLAVADNGRNFRGIDQYHQYSRNYGVQGNVEEPSRSRHLSERLEMLSNHKHVEHEPVNDPGLVERLPPEVLLAVFSHLDDISLWSAANVCRRWCGLLSTHITPQQWQQHVQLRWPLYKPIGHVRNWYKVYDQLASSAPCRTCLAQTSLRTGPPRIEENSWRRNRLRNELKSLRIDPPEGIEATPLDQMCCHWQATITGPVGSPYEGGLFYLYLQVPYSYPMCPPVVRFLTKILHPNVSRHGDVGIDSIHHNWSLALTISKVLISVQSLLTDPYCQVCMEPQVGEMYMNDRERFEEVARAWTWKYAMHDVVTPS